MLTGFMQRHDFNIDLKDLFRKNKKFYLLYYDVNNLHNINREKGFAEGDALIKRVSERIIRVAPKSLFYRPTGDEFFAISECEPPLSIEIKEATGLMLKSGDFNSVEELLEKADKTMIELKAKLKNRRKTDKRS
jgi:GGDEF domain-containing protein